MRRTLGKPVRTGFERRLKVALPMFRDASSLWVIPPGVRVYQYDFHPDLVFFVVLVTSPKDERFTIEMAWSPVGRFPTQRTAYLPTDPPQEDGLRFRLPWLWVDRDQWWWIGGDVPAECLGNSEAMMAWLSRPDEVLLPEVEPLLDDAFERLSRFGLPYFARIAAERGYEPPAGWAQGTRSG
jgi:hypothetical protein